MLIFAEINLCLFITCSFAGGTWDWEYLGFASPEVSYKLYISLQYIETTNTRHLLVGCIGKPHRQS